jgi:hypothetical protein
MRNTHTTKVEYLEVLALWYFYKETTTGVLL